jgi:cell division protease FtsH
MELKGRTFSVGYVVATVIALILIYAVLYASHGENLSYSEFKMLVRQGKVGDVVLGRETITGTLGPGDLEGLLPREKLDELKRRGRGVPRFTTARIDDPGLVAELEAAKVKFTGRVENTWLSTLLSWVLPTLLFVGVWMFVMRRIGRVQDGPLAIGKSKAKVYVQHSTGVTFEDVAGIDEAGAS